MVGVKFGFVLSALLLAGAAQAEFDASKANLKLPICELLKHSVSSSTLVSLPGSASYDADLAHWATSSSQASKCTVRPGSAKDVGIVLTLVGLTRTPFNVKGGGHASNPGWSSSPGVLIAMSNFKDVNYDAKSQTATIGAGLIWDDVYAALEPYNVSVVGGRVSGVGVAGFTLGGGYSWKTNQYGLTLDSVTAYDLVKPSGAVVTVTKTSDPDLFFGLKGGYNNFGIVTKFTMTAYPQTEVWGGSITFAPGDESLDGVADAIVQWEAEVKDPKAEILPTYNFYQGSLFLSCLVFYDAPTPPSGIFDKLLQVPTVDGALSTRSYLSLVQASPANQTYGLRGVFNTIPIRSYSPTILAAVKNESLFWGKVLGSKPFLLSYDVEPFLPDIYSHGNSPSAYPPTRSFGFSPFNIYYAWGNEEDDAEMQEAARQSAAQLRSVAVGDGQDLTGSGPYPNYAIFNTPVSDIYGANLSKLRALKARVDPLNIMGLAGGWKV